MNRIDSRFARLKAEGRAGFVSFITAGDPDTETSLALLQALPKAGVDIIELGMPFTDPMADGIAIQAANLRALASGMTLAKTLQLVRDFRKNDNETPIVLMGYYNPVYSYGAEKFVIEAHESGVDGLIIVDLPPEEDEELRLPAQKAGLAIIRLATPTTDGKRLPVVLSSSAGFLYYVSLTGVTGTQAIDEVAVARKLAFLRQHTPLPLAVGFGIKDAPSAATVARSADAVVVGSAIVQKVADGVSAKTPRATLVDTIAAYVKTLADAVHTARS